MTDLDLRTHAGDDHARHHLDEDCPECDTDHRVFTSLPNQPLPKSDVQSLETSDGIEFAAALVSIPGDIVGATADMVTEDVVLATANTVRTLSRYEEEGGWVVKQELAVPEDESAAGFAARVHAELRAEFDHVDEADVERGDLVQ